MAFKYQNADCGVMCLTRNPVNSGVRAQAGRRAQGKDRFFMSRRIEKLLRKALLKNGAMAYALYEHELAEHIDYWYEGLKKDRDEFVFAVTENTGDTAMVLLTKIKRIYVNEEAREYLLGLWGDVYRNNMNLLIPMMADELANDIIAVNGVKTAS